MSHAAKGGQPSDQVTEVGQDGAGHPALAGQIPSRAPQGGRACLESRPRAGRPTSTLPAGPRPAAGKTHSSVWYRAAFMAGQEREITLQANGGTGQPPHGQEPAFFQVWADGSYLGAAPADGEDQTFNLPESTLPPGEEASLCVLVHNLGQNLDWNDDGLSKQNRGLFDAVLPADGEVTWRLQGAGDPSGESDLLRTLYNVGGLYGERHGWHLPGHDDSGWAEAETLNAESPGVHWYRTEFELDV